MSEEKSLRECLHFYLGCDVKTHKGIEKFVGINWDSKEYPIITLAYASSVYGAYKRTEIEPILRPLTSITDQEAIEIANMVAEYECGSTEWLIERSHTCIILKCGHYSVTIFTYEVIVSFKYKKEEEQIDNQANLISYLLLKHIDVFNWLDEGLAINKTENEKSKI